MLIIRRFANLGDRPVMDKLRRMLGGREADPEAGTSDATGILTGSSQVFSSTLMHNANSLLNISGSLFIAE